MSQDMRRCSRCHSQKPATHFQKVQNGQTIELASCIECRTKKNEQRRRRLRVHGGLISAEVETPFVSIARRSQLPPRHKLSLMNNLCQHCLALHFLEEKTKKSSNLHPFFPKCCAGGKVVLPSFQTIPSELRRYFTTNTPEAKEFRENIRAYNNVLSFTSLGVKEESFNQGNGGVYTFRIKGQLCHRIGTLVPSTEEQPKFAQIYIHDPQNQDVQLQNRLSIFSNLNPQILQTLQNMLAERNPYVTIFQTVGETIQAEPDITRTLQLRIVDPSNTNKDPRTYNTATADEIGVLIVGLGDEDVTHRDIVLRYQQAEQVTNLSHISELHASYLPLRYVLILVNGEQGWHAGIPLTGTSLEDRHDEDQQELEELDLTLTRHQNHSMFNNNPPAVGKGGSTRVTLRLFHAYHLHIRQVPHEVVLFSAGRLFQEWCVDAAAVYEQNNLRWVKANQKKLRADLYKGLADTIEGQNHRDATSIGQRMVLPSTFAGSPRQMAELYQDAMAVVRFFGKPDIFLTMTCNPSWPEIQQNLGPYQQASDRPDIVSRVFQLKLDALLEDILKQGVLGIVVAHIYVIEFQKRGLPHAHMLLIFHPSARLHTVEDIDSTVSAELPDHTIDPELWETVTTCMLHGPCGTNFANAPCMKDGRGQAGCCSKRYPRNYQESTIIGDDGYPQYRRRNNQQSIVKTRLASDGQRVPFSYTNEWVVPYNPYLSKKYNCHINIEICSSIYAVKYLYKYVYKGPDRAMVNVNDPERLNEPQLYLDARYISAPEATWKLFSNKMHDGGPTVVRLQLHLENEQMVLFNEEDDLESIVNDPTRQKTTLTEYFETNKVFSEAMTLPYTDFPTKFVWSKKNKKWTPRKKGFAIGRMYFCGPKAGERFYLRLLLTKIVGATSYQQLRTVNGVLHPTYQLACVAHRLLQDDQEWSLCLQEASLVHTGFQLRELFGIILLESNPTNPLALWEAQKENLSDDCRQKLRTAYFTPNPSEEQCYSLALCFIERQLQASGKRLQDFNLPEPGFNYDTLLDNTRQGREIAEQRMYDCEELSQRVKEQVLSLNHLQREAYNRVLESMNQQAQLFFLDGPGGTGKTFLENLLLASVRAKGNIALAVASSGIAALLLEGGRTAHSTFKIPIAVNKDSFCGIKKNSGLADMLRLTKLIVWDEAPMQHRHAFEAVDRTLQDLLDNPQPFGGISVLFAGDFRQCLPVVPGGSRAQIVRSSLKFSFLWRSIKALKLEENYRLQRPGLTESEKLIAKDYGNYILKVGENQLHNTEQEGSVNSGYIKLLPEMLLSDNTMTGLINKIYPAIHLPDTISTDYFGKRAILAPRNTDVDDMNSIILRLLPGSSTKYLSADSVSQENSELYATEFLNSIVLPGLPLHCCELKVGAPIIVLRNINPLNGLCNGTRLRITHLGTRVLGGEILGGSFKGKQVMIPRINLNSNPDGDIKFELSRRQFPVRLAFAMTINKAQGQSLKYVGINLEREVFSHGQLYVALSRASHPCNVKILLSSGPDKQGTTSLLDGYTHNIVYTEVL